jgi:ABC-type transport system involved in cytochrome bd biosynthesis fused ATPase/permease subunit
VIVAHRLSTVRRAERILILDRGVIVEDGSHAELVEADGPYARFVALQRIDAAGHEDTIDLDGSVSAGTPRGR